jgi:hypothetical protein
MLYTPEVLPVCFFDNASLRVAPFLIVTVIVASSVIAADHGSGYSVAVSLSLSGRIPGGHAG